MKSASTVTSASAVGKLLRQIRLPDDVDDSKIKANFANGVLTVSLPKSERAMVAEKKIEIRSF